MYDTILLPVAPESDANPALPHAVELARRYDATVHVLSSADTTVTTAADAHAAELGERIESTAESRVDEIADRLESDGVSVTRHVGRGTPGDTIVEAIREYGIDVVVMPTHNREGLERVLLGSVTERVIRQSPVPVLTVPLNA